MTEKLIERLTQAEEEWHECCDDIHVILGSAKARILADADLISALRTELSGTKKEVTDMETRAMAAEAQKKADAEVIKAAGPLVKRLKALQTYFDLSDEELESMTRNERADTIRQHKLITDALAAFSCAMLRAREGGDV